MRLIQKAGFAFHCAKGYNKSREELQNFKRDAFSRRRDSVKTSSTTTNKAPPKERYSKQARKGRLKL